VPNEPIQCPNCGGGHVRQLAADSYTCEHCQTDFRWVDPTRRTVVHESRVCKCGNNAVAHCVRCREPLCKKHKSTWVWGVGDIAYRSRTVEHLVSELCHELYEMLASGIVITRDGGGADSDAVRQTVRQTMKERGLPDPESAAILCEKCMVECLTTFKSILDESILDAHNKIAEQGPACTCTTCLSQSLLGQCSICKVWVCSRHGAECKKCHQIVCMRHIGGGGWCQTCEQQWKTSQASPWFGKLWKKLGLQK
jgi:hypothetical protein